MNPYTKFQTNSLKIPQVTMGHYTENPNYLTIGAVCAKKIQCYIS